MPTPKSYLEHEVVAELWLPLKLVWFLAFIRTCQVDARNGVQQHARPPAAFPRFGAERTLPVALTELRFFAAHHGRWRCIPSWRSRSGPVELALRRTDSRGACVLPNSVHRRRPLSGRDGNALPRNIFHGKCTRPAAAFGGSRRPKKAAISSTGRPKGQGGRRRIGYPSGPLAGGCLERFGSGCRTPRNLFNTCWLRARHAGGCWCRRW
jgi:hypothetical protein